MDPQITQHSFPERKKAGFWRKLGGGSLTISVILHLGILALGALWIIRIIPPPQEKIVDFMPTGGGGGSPANQSISQQKQRKTVSKPNLSRISVTGAASTITLPEMDDSAQMPTLGSLSSGMSGGLGGNGAGGGRGDGFGKGFGSGTGPGAGLGTGTANPFGFTDPNANALEGVFYDLKQTKDRKTTDTTPESTRTIIAEFTKRGWKESSLRNYYRAPQKLYQSKLYIPLMQAESAPAAFHCEKEVQPRCWMVIYRGTVVAPKTGRFRFVGAGDDVLVVRFNGKTVFDHGFTSGTTGIHISQNLAVFRDENTENKDLEREIKRAYPMKLPVTYYQYPTTQNWNGTIGGLAVGADFSVTAGKAYPIEILISEIPGGLFCASLMIEEIGAKYQTTPSGAPILPVFRTDHSLPKQEGDNAPPFDAAGPIWQVQKRSASIDF